MTRGPELTPERLILRRWHPEDRAPFAAMNADSEVMGYIGDGSPVRSDESDALVERIEGGSNSRASVCGRSNGFVGFVRFVGLAVATFLPEILPAVEIGWRMARHAWRESFATEGVRAGARFAFQEADLDRIVSRSAIPTTPPPCG